MTYNTECLIIYLFATTDLLWLAICEGLWSAFSFKKKSYFFLFEEQIALKERPKVCICWFTLPNGCNGQTWATPKLGSRSFSWVSSMCSAQRLEPSATPNPQAESWSGKGAAWTWNGALLDAGATEPSMNFLRNHAGPSPTLFTQIVFCCWVTDVLGCVFK